jgi:glycosyltransferase involved in cell wall biosynthesis
MVKKVLMVGLFPPPYSSGERILNMNIKGILEEKYEVEVINLSVDTLSPKTFGMAKLRYYAKASVRFNEALKEIKVKCANNKYHALYIVTSSSSSGHLKDYLILKHASPVTDNVFAFIQNGNYDTIFDKTWHKKKTEKFLTMINKMVFLSKGLQNKVIKHIPIEQTTIIRNSIDKAVVFSDEEIQTKVDSYTGSHVRLLYLSNMNPTKGYMDLGNALRILKEENVQFNFKADFIGEWLSEDQRKSFEHFVKEHNLIDHVTIHGKVNDREKLKEFLRESSIFILPTYFPKEAQPVSIIEALNAGTPIISTYHASIPEYVEDDYNGYLVEKKSPESIVVAIKKLVVTPEHWRKIAQGARDSYVKDLSNEAYKNNILTLFSGKKL